MNIVHLEHCSELWPFSLVKYTTGFEDFPSHFTMAFAPFKTTREFPFFSHTAYTDDNLMQAKDGDQNALSSELAGVTTQEVKRCTHTSCGSD